MNVVIASVSAFGLGAAAAYLFDPNRGRRRRAMTADRVTSVVHAVNDAFEVTSRDVRNRLAGTGASLRTRVRHDRLSDEVLSERVRAQLGGLVRHPRALEVDAHEGARDTARSGGRRRSKDPHPARATHTRCARYGGSAGRPSRERRRSGTPV
jgi:hypothetical protein